MLTEKLIENQNEILEAKQKYQRRNDNVNHPSHYEKSCSMECIDTIEITFGIEAVIHFCKGNAFKYLWRYKNKNGLEDLQKALWYCNKGSEKVKEFYQDNEYIDEQIDTMVKKAYMYMEQQNANRQNPTNNAE